MEQSLPSFMRGYSDPVGVMGLDGEVWLYGIWYVKNRGCGKKLRHVTPVTSLQVVLGLPALFYPSTKWMDHSERLFKLSLLSSALEKFSTWEILRLICNIMWVKDSGSISLRSTPGLCINGWWMPPWLEIHLSSLWPETPKFPRATSQMACVIFSMEGLFPFNSGGESQRESGRGDCNSPKHFIISVCVITSLIPF